ncbi:MAG: alpha-galactosidase [Acidimicrobiales bacterium]
MNGRFLVLRQAGVMVAVQCDGPGLPRLVYWGDDLGPLSDEDLAALPLAGQPGAPAGFYPAPVTMSPSRAQGWPGWPGLSGHRSGRFTQPLFVLDSATTNSSAPTRTGKGAANPASETQPDGHQVLTYSGTDQLAQLRLEGELRLSPEGVLQHRQTLTSTACAADEPYTVDDLVCLFPVPGQVSDVLDHAGRWANEAQLQRTKLGQGTWLREQRRGRTGPDTPLLLAVGSEGFGFRSGTLWGVHLGWSGDQRYLAQRLNTGTVMLGAGEILSPGEVVLGPGESLTTPWCYAVYSDRGLDGASARLHTMVRRRPSHPRRHRPVTLNTWEAVYFSHSYERLAQLADIAAEIGVERFVIDDGWFGSRRDDTKGLGDWYASKEVWPDGLGPIGDYVRARGMELGLWVEPEMVSLSSELARAHPDWVMGSPGRMPPEQRHQQVLDVANPEAFEYLLSRISSLVSEYKLSYLKWDHNRDLADPVHRSGPKAGRPAVRDQTLAAYRLMDELRSRHPGLEIESCSSGGSRVDLGVLGRTDRIWASDCIDPIERVHIVPGWSTLVPLELIGAHVASERSHVTGRRHNLSLRLAVALFGHVGLEWDLAQATAAEREQLAAWVKLAKSLRELLSSGELVRLERPADPATTCFGVVANDRSEALFLLVRDRTSPQYGTAPLCPQGLDPNARYRVERLALADDEVIPTVTVAGSVLMGAGVAVPDLQPEQAHVYHFTRDLSTKASQAQSWQP